MHACMHALCADHLILFASHPFSGDPDGDRESLGRSLGSMMFVLSAQDINV